MIKIWTEKRNEKHLGTVESQLELHLWDWKWGAKGSALQRSGLQMDGDGGGDYGGDHDNNLMLVMIVMLIYR